MTDMQRDCLPRELCAQAVTADIAVFLLEWQETESYRRDETTALRLLLIRRGIPPFRGMWALPGGFLREDETLRGCALREVTEETGITPAALMPAGVFDRPDRDPRGRVISHAYVAVLNEAIASPTGGADADEAQWFGIRMIPEADGTIRLLLENDDECLTARLRRRDRYECEENDGIAFDHAEIIAETFAALRRAAKDPEAVLELLPEYFTLSALQRVREVITGEHMAAANFRRKMAEYVQQTDRFETGAGHRPARLYTKRSKTEGMA